MKVLDYQVGSLIKMINYVRVEKFMKCENCKKKFGDLTCKTDIFENKIVYICPHCKHGNY